MGFNPKLKVSTKSVWQLTIFYSGPYIKRTQKIKTLIHAPSRKLPMKVPEFESHKHNEKI